MESGLSLRDVAGASQIYPTYARVIRDLSAQFQAARLERGFVQTALKFFFGYQPRTSTSGPDGAGTTPAPTTPNGSQAEEGHPAEPVAAVHGHGH
jgi:hypothetical protein